MNKLNLIDIVIAEKIGKVLEYLVKEKSYDLYDVCSKWLYSKTFFSILDDDVSVYSQSRFYIARHFEENSGPLYLASELYKDDDVSLATAYRNQFETELDYISNQMVDSLGTEHSRDVGGYYG